MGYPKAKLPKELTDWNRPTDEELIKTVLEIGMNAAAVRYGVSGNILRAWHGESRRNINSKNEIRDEKFLNKLRERTRNDPVFLYRESNT